MINRVKFELEQREVSVPDSDVKSASEDEKGKKIDNVELMGSNLSTDALSPNDY